MMEKTTEHKKGKIPIFYKILVEVRILPLCER